MDYNVVILGGGPAGLTASIYAARASLDPLVVEGLLPGGQLTITTDVENYPGFAEPVEGPKLMADMQSQAKRLGAKFVSGEAKKIDLRRRPFTIEVDSEKIRARAVIIATGASTRWLGLESEAKLRGKGVSSCATCDGFFFKGKELAVVGGGDTAMEEAVFLTRFASKVTVVHRRDALRATKVLQDRAMANPKISLAWNSVIDEIKDVKKGEVTGVVLKDTRTGKKRDLACQGVFIAIGYDPETRMFKGQLEMDALGYIVTRKTSMETSVPGVFAAGDCQDRTYRQAVTAAGTGCMAAMDAVRFLQEQ